MDSDIDGDGIKNETDPNPVVPNEPEDELAEPRPVPGGNITTDPTDPFGGSDDDSGAVADAVTISNWWLLGLLGVALVFSFYIGSRAMRRPRVDEDSFI